MMCMLVSLLCKMSPSKNSITTSMGLGVDIMAQFVRGDQDSVQQLLDLWIAGFGLSEDLANEVY
jgi:hypothetical protein